MDSLLKAYSKFEEKIDHTSGLDEVRIDRGRILQGFYSSLEEINIDI